VALQHVDESTRVVVVAGASLEPERLVVDDLNGLDVLVVPYRLEKPVREPCTEKGEDVAAPQKVVDPEHLSFGNQRGNELVELTSPGSVGTERLLHRQHRALRQLDQLKRLAGASSDRRWQGEEQRRRPVTLRQQRPQVFHRGHVALAVVAALRRTRDPPAVPTVPAVATVATVRKGVLDTPSPLLVAELGQPGSEQLDGPAVAPVAAQQRRQARQQKPARQVSVCAQHH